MNGQDQNQRLSPQALQSALRTGLKMLNDDEVRTPNAWNRDLLALEGIFVAIMSGNLELKPTEKGKVEEPKPFPRNSGADPEDLIEGEEDPAGGPE